MNSIGSDEFGIIAYLKIDLFFIIYYLIYLI